MAKQKAPIPYTPYFFNQQAERKRRMAQLCANYNPQPFQQMTPAEMKSFSTRLAYDAISSCSLTKEEALIFAKVVFDSIQFFNQRTPPTNHRTQNNPE